MSLPATTREKWHAAACLFCVVITFFVLYMVTTVTVNITKDLGALGNIFDQQAHAELLDHRDIEFIAIPSAPSTRDIGKDGEVVIPVTRYYVGQLHRVVDGDTVDIVVVTLGIPLKHGTQYALERIRLLHVDTPEPAPRQSSG